MRRFWRWIFSDVRRSRRFVVILCFAVGLAVGLVSGRAWLFR